MKNLSKTLFLSIILVVNIQMINGQNQGNIYDFPVKPGTKEWKQLKTGQEMIDVCQIPDSILIVISTENLSRLCLNYPLLGDMMFSDNLQEGFEIMASNFNGFQELFKRKDAGTELLKLYKSFDINSFEKNKGKVIKNMFFDMCIDVVMSQPVFLKKLNVEEEKILMKESLDRLKIRKEKGNSLFRQKTTAVILSRLLIKNNAVNRNMNVFKSDKFLLLNNYFVLTDDSFINIIKQETDLFLKK